MLLFGAEGRGSEPKQGRIFALPLQPSNPQSCLQKWCSLLESNQRPPPYQGGALPTELSEHVSAALHDCEEQTSIHAGLQIFQPPSMMAKNKPASMLDYSNCSLCGFNGAGDGNRTRTSSLEGYSSTIELLPLGDPTIFFPLSLLGGGRWITPGILPSAPPGPAFGCSKSLQAILSNQFHIFGGSNPPHTRCPAFNTWWREVDSNHRRHEPADLQSAPVGRLGIPPKFVCAFTCSNDRPRGSTREGVTEPVIVRSRPCPCQGGTDSARTGLQPACGRWAASR